MARSIGTIYDLLNQAKNNQEELDGLAPGQDNFTDLRTDQENNPSTVAIWRIWLYIVAVLTHINDVLFDKYVEEVDAKIGASRWATFEFLQAKALAYQNGYTLAWNGSQFVYSAIDAGAQIVKRAAVVASGTTILFKVAKLDGSDLPIPLTTGEKTSFQAYIDRLVYPGTQYAVISEVSDDLKLILDVVFDPQVLNPDGSLISDATVYPVVDAINDYVGNLPFNGVINLTALVDAIQAAPGVVDPVLKQAFSKYGGLPYEEAEKNITPNAGHSKLNEGDSTITYISEVNV